MAADATPSCIGLADPSAAVSLPIPEPTPTYQAELAAALLSTSVAEPATTIYIDNVAALVNVHKNRCPPAWLKWVVSLFRCRSVSYRLVPSAVNPADLPSRPT